MSYTPLFQGFLASLKRDGIPVSVRDYERIAVAFHSQREWSLPAIRDTLAALLVNDPEQKRVFDQRFETFFDSDRSTPIPAFDLALALRDLAEVRPQAAPKDRAPVSRQKDAARSAWLPVAAILEDTYTDHMNFKYSFAESTFQRK